VREPGTLLVAIGSRVRIRSVRSVGVRLVPFPITGEDSLELVVTIVAPGDMGLYRLGTHTPLARALLGHRVGDLVDVQAAAGTSRFEILAVEIER
jgi:hypothetical protein